MVRNSDDNVDGHLSVHWQRVVVTSFLDQTMAAGINDQTNNQLIV